MKTDDNRCTSTKFEDGLPELYVRYEDAGHRDAYGIWHRNMVLAAVAREIPDSWPERLRSHGCAFDSGDSFGVLRPSARLQSLIAKGGAIGRWDGEFDPGVDILFDGKPSFATRERFNREEAQMTGTWIGGSTLTQEEHDYLDAMDMIGVLQGE